MGTQSGGKGQQPPQMQSQGYQMQNYQLGNSGGQQPAMSMQGGWGGGWQPQQGLSYFTPQGGAQGSYNQPNYGQPVYGQGAGGGTGWGGWSGGNWYPPSQQQPQGGYQGGQGGYQGGGKGSRPPGMGGGKGGPPPGMQGQPMPEAGGMGGVGQIAGAGQQPIVGAGGQNPIPTNTPADAAGTTGWVQNFKFGDANRTGDPIKDMAQDTFNKIKDKYGHNAAWSFAAENWNQLGGYGPGGLRQIMDEAGVGKDQGRILNTYGANGKYFDGLRADTSQLSFDPNSEYNQLVNPYKQAALQAALAKQQANRNRG